MELHELLLKLRRAARYTQTEVAERTGVPQHTISRMERGFSEKVSFTDVVLVAREYGVSPTQIAQTLGLYEQVDSQGIKDYRWDFIVSWLMKAPPEEVDALLGAMYDRAIFLTRMRETGRKSDQKTA